MWRAELIYRQRKPVYWSPSSKTALAEAELEYNERHISRCAFVRFPLVKLPDVLVRDTRVDASHISALIWTTTPWTLPANKAIAVNAGLDYCLVEIPALPELGQLLICRDRLEHVKSFLERDVQVKVIIETIKGSDLVRKTEYINILQGKGWEPQKIIDARFVTATSGTGLVHLAPGHGLDDYNACKELDSGFKSPVDDDGCFTAEAYPDNPNLLQGKNVFREGMRAVIDFLENAPSMQVRGIELWGSHILATHQIEHKYPLDWRTKRPLIVRATAQWFADIEGIKKEALSALASVGFTPESAKARLESFIRGRNYWCISRQRPWGVPIPALYRVDDGSNSAVMTKETISHINTVFNMRGTDAWWSDAEDDPAWIPSFLEGKYVRGKDTMDVWFDSGSSWTMLEKWHGFKPVADVYLEGTDQHRGWFQSSLLTYSAFYDWKDGIAKAPFAKLITHGFTLDHKGRKMSKSMGNVVHPEEIMTGSLFAPPAEGKNVAQHSGNEKRRYLKGIGTDVLRLWVANHDYKNDIRINEATLKSVHGNLQKYRITVKWLLGVLEDYTTTSAASSLLKDYTNDHQLLDQIALHHLRATSAAVHEAYSQYEFFKAVSAINRYINHNLSSFYFEAIKDRVYAGTIHDRLSAQRVLVIILNELLLMLSPVTPLLIEEAFDHMPMHVRHEGEHPLRRIWTPTQAGAEDNKDYNNNNNNEDDAVAAKAMTTTTIPNLKVKAEVLERVHSAIRQAQEEARNEKKIGSGLECDVCIFLPEECDGVVQEVLSPERTAELAAMFVVSKLEIRMAEAVEGADAGVGAAPFIPPASLSVDVSSSFSSSSSGWKYESQFSVTFPVSSSSTTIKTTTCSSPGEMGKVVILPASRHKCPRCWRYVAPEKNKVCGRCEAVLSGRDAVVGF